MPLIASGSSSTRWLFAASSTARFGNASRSGGEAGSAVILFIDTSSFSSPGASRFATSGPSPVMWFAERFSSRSAGSSRTTSLRYVSPTSWLCARLSAVSVPAKNERPSGSVAKRLW